MNRPDDGSSPFSPDDRSNLKSPEQGALSLSQQSFNGSQQQDIFSQQPTNVNNNINTSDMYAFLPSDVSQLFTSPLPPGPASPVPYTSTHDIFEGYNDSSTSTLAGGTSFDYPKFPQAREYPDEKETFDRHGYGNTIRSNDSASIGSDNTRQQQQQYSYTQYPSQDNIKTGNTMFPPSNTGHSNDPNTIRRQSISQQQQQQSNQFNPNDTNIVTTTGNILTALQSIVLDPLSPQHTMMATVSSPGHVSNPQQQQFITQPQQQQQQFPAISAPPVQQHPSSHVVNGSIGVTGSILSPTSAHLTSPAPSSAYQQHRQQTPQTSLPGPQSTTRAVSLPPDNHDMQSTPISSTLSSPIHPHSEAELSLPHHDTIQPQHDNTTSNDNTDNNDISYHAYHVEEEVIDPEVAKKNNRIALKRMFKHMIPEKTMIIFGLIALMIASVCNLCQPLLIGKLIDKLGQPGVQVNDTKTILLTTVFVLTLNGITNFINMSLLWIAGDKVVARVRKILFRSIIYREISFFDTIRSGELLSRISTDVTALNTALTTEVAEFCQRVAIIFGALTYMFYLSWDLTFIALGIAPVVGFMGHTLARKFHGFAKLVNEEISASTVVAEETISNIRTVRALAKEELMERRYSDKIDASYILNKKMKFMKAFQRTFVYYVGGMCVAGVLWYGAYKVVNGEITPGDLLTFVLFGLQVGERSGQSLDNITLIQQAAGACEKVLQLIEDAKDHDELYNTYQKHYNDNSQSIINTIDKKHNGMIISSTHDAINKYNQKQQHQHPNSDDIDDPLYTHTRSSGTNLHNSGSNISNNDSIDELTSLPSSSSQTALVGPSSASSCNNNNKKTSYLTRLDTNQPIILQNIKFYYPSRPKHTILHDLSFTIQPGKKIALVGTSGSGKSTVIQLLERMYEPVSGTIYLGNTDIRNISQVLWRQSISYVEQQCSLFCTNIRDNVLMSVNHITLHDCSTYMKHKNDIANKYGQDDEIWLGQQKQQQQHRQQYPRNNDNIVIQLDTLDNTDELNLHNIPQKKQQHQHQQYDVCECQYNYSLPLCQDSFGKIYTMNDVISACRQANAHDFITKLPQSYATMVGERGIQLSGGQKQRISIARAIIANSSILLLDEASSALDSESERLVQESLDTLMVGRTVIMIAHRLSTIKTVDYIYCFSQGNIVEHGTHQQLMALQGMFYRLVQMQQLVTESSSSSTTTTTTGNGGGDNIRQ